MFLLIELIHISSLPLPPPKKKTAVQPIPQGNVQVVPGSSRPQVLASKGSSGASGSGQPTSSNYYSTMLSNASSAISSSGKSQTQGGHPPSHV